MHEIKYQAWDETIRTMIPVTDLNLESKYLIGKIGNRFVSAKFDEVKLLEYPGSKDSHGKDVCEGDILEAVFELLDGEMKNIMDRGVVVKKDYAFQVHTFEGHHEPLHEWAQLSEELKVIGNIYENPELLPGVKTQ